MGEEKNPSLPGKENLKYSLKIKNQPKYSAKTEALYSTISTSYDSTSPEKKRAITGRYIDAIRALIPLKTAKRALIL